MSPQAARRLLRSAWRHGQAAYDSARNTLESKIREQPEDTRLHSSLGIACAGLGPLTQPPPFQEALEGRPVKRGEDHSATLATMNDFGVLGPQHPHTLDSLNQLVHLYESWNKPDETEKWRAKRPAISDR